MAPGVTVTPGRVVLYTLAEGDGVKEDVVGQERPAIVVRVWSPEADGNGCANLLVFCDGENDLPPPPLIEEEVAVGSEPIAATLAAMPPGPLLWATSRTYSATPANGCWRWPPRA